MRRLPFTVANSEVSSSGIVVAKLTTVAPMMNFGIPDISASQLAASTKKSPPLTINTSPTRNIITIPMMLSLKNVKT